MARLKKSWIVILVLLVAALAVAGLSTLFRDRQEERAAAAASRVILAVPDDAVWIVETRSLPDAIRALVRTGPFSQAIDLLPGASGTVEFLKMIDSLAAQQDKFRDLLGRAPVAISYHQLGRNLFQYLVVVDNQGNALADEAHALASALCGSRGQRSQREYNNRLITRITFGADALIPGISMVEDKGFLVISPSPILVENSARMLGGSSVPDPSLTSLSETVGPDAAAHVYLNLALLPGWLGGLTGNPHRKRLEAFNTLGDWTALDLRIRNDALTLAGFADPGDTLRSYIGIFRGQEPARPEADQYLPSTASASLSICLSDPASMLKRLGDFSGGTASGNRRLRLIEKAGMTPVGNVVHSWGASGLQELTIAWLSGAIDESFRQVVLLRVKDAGVTMKMLFDPEGKGGPKSFRRPPSVRMAKTGTGEEAPVFRMPYEGLPEILGGGLFSAVAGRYFSWIENTMVLADDPALVEEILIRHGSGKTLAKDPNYLAVNGLASSRSNLSFFMVPYRAKPLLKSFLHPEASGQLAENDPFLLKPTGMGFQMSAEGGRVFQNGYVSFARIDYSKPQTIWEARLPGRVGAGPFLVKNHQTQAAEIILQDESGMLCLLNSSGKVLWKKQLPGPINSQVYQVDVLRNGRLQFLFSTGKALHLIDRNGNYLPKFPVELNSAATSGMTLADFDGNRDYRIFIPLSDNRIYCFDRSGNPVKGWNRIQASGSVNQPVKCFRIKDKDYLVFTDQVKVYITDRKGQVRVRTEKDFALARNAVFYSDPSDSDGGPAFVVTDADGKVCRIRLDGSVSIREISRFGRDHLFTAGDINRDGRTEYLFADGNRLEAYSGEGEKLFNRRFDGEISGMPEILPQSGENALIAVRIRSSAEIFLVSASGEIREGFPLQGWSPFLIGKLDPTASFRNLLVGSQDGYLYNYAIK